MTGSQMKTLLKPIPLSANLTRQDMYELLARIKKHIMRYTGEYFIHCDYRVPFYLYKMYDRTELDINRRLLNGTI